MLIKFVIILLIFINLNSCTHQIWTTGNPYQLGVSLLGNYFNYTFHPMLIDNKLEGDEFYTHVSVSHQKVVLFTSKKRVLMFGSNQNFPLGTDSPSTVVDVATTPVVQLKINEPISRIVSINMYILVFGKTKIQYFGELSTSLTFFFVFSQN